MFSAARRDTCPGREGFLPGRNARWCAETIKRNGMWIAFLLAFLMESFKDLTGDGYFKMK